jgi:SAM-dependent methyltransferase
MPVNDATQRFSSRVEKYVRYRPGYPPEIIDLLRAECGLLPEHLISDIASGTGLFTRLLLENGNRVFGVEPNAEMRKAGEEFLAAFPNFANVAGTAEATTLPDHSLDFVTAAQAAHWFDLKKTRREFVRILKPGGWVVLVWNERRLDSTAFLRDYEQLLLEFGTDYQEVRHEHVQVKVQEFFHPAPVHARSFDMRQKFGYEGLEGRVLSSSYMPQAGHPKYESMIERLHQLFNQYADDGLVEMDYDTRVYYGQPG